MISPIALTAACVLDLAVGDPRWLPHPVVLMGKLIVGLERAARRHFQTPRGKRAAGFLITLVVVLGSYGLAHLLLVGAWQTHPALGWSLGVLFAYTTLAARSLHGEAFRVKRALREEKTEDAKRALAGIVGRETKGLSVTEIVRATVETVSENTSDGVIAPLFYLAIGGPAAAVAYKAVNTLDSMLGYKNERYRDLGWFPARFDDVVNFVPARITGLLMVAASAFLNLSAGEAYRIMRRDGAKHTSPNAGIPEAAAAGALGVQLGGRSVYKGIPVEKALIGDSRRELTMESIGQAVALMYAASFLMGVIAVLIRLVI